MNFRTMGIKETKSEGTSEQRDRASNAGIWHGTSAVPASLYSISPLHLAQEPLDKVISMVKGNGEDSYSKNSQWQNAVSKISLLHLSEALEKVALPQESGSVVLADLGSASGPNSIGNIAFIIDRLKHRLPRDAEYQIYFNDLPCNDFNNLFMLLSNDSRVNTSFIAGVPGSFFDRLFPHSHVQVFFSSASLHWLSKIPAPVLNKCSPAYNRSNPWIMNSRSAVAKAYQEQASLDLTNFLQARAAELVPGGVLFFNCLGSSTSQPNENCDDTLAEFLSIDLRKIWNDLVGECLVSEEQRDTFNVPVYTRSIEDLNETLASCSDKFEVLTAKMHKFDVLAIDILETTEANELSRKLRSMFKAFINNILVAHIGETVSEIIWQRYDRMLEKRIRQSPQDLKLRNSTCIVSLMRK